MLGVVLRGVGVLAGGPLEVGSGRVLVTASKQEPPSVPSIELSLFCKLQHLPGRQPPAATRHFGFSAVQYDHISLCTERVSC